MSNETKFTKGEWDVFDTHPSNACFYIAPKQPVQSYGGSKVVFDEVCTVFNSKGNAKADANLIKTAPKLYAMLEHLVNQDCINDCSLDEEVRALLAEARG